MGFRYKYKHLNCGYCADLENKLRCPYQHCPYILDNLDDLRHDCVFHHAISIAENCSTFHRSTLLLIQRWGLQCPA